MSLFLKNYSFEQLTFLQIRQLNKAMSFLGEHKETDKNSVNEMCESDLKCVTCKV